MVKAIYGFARAHKRAIMMALLVAGVAALSFAQAKGKVDTGKMDDTVYKIVDFFNGGWVKGVCCIALIAECLGLLVMGGQNPQIFKKFLPFIVGTVLFMCAGKIVTIIWGSQDTAFSDELNNN